VSQLNEPAPVFIQQSLLPTVSIDSICAQELMRKMKAQAQALEVCGDYMLRQQVTIERLSANVDALLELMTARIEGKHLPKTVRADQAVVGHAGYSAKEFAGMINRSTTYVYRLLYDNQIEANMAGRITHESYVKMQAKMSMLQKRRRVRKWS
jgi:hypothetical protein